MTTKRGPCPQCDKGPRDTALSMTTDDRGTVSFCHRCGYTEHDNIALPSFQLPRTVAKPAPLDWSARAQSIWQQTQPLRGTLGETYLRYRGCALPPRGSHLRYLPPNDRYPPSLCAALTDIATGRPISLHFTRLAAGGKGKAGTDCDKLLLGGHRKRGACIRLWPDDCVTHGLAIAEGIETALASAHIFTPIWAAVDAGNLSQFPIIDINALTIIADHDDAGLRAARECAARWRDAGREVRILTPNTAGHDAADEVKIEVVA